MNCTGNLDSSSEELTEIQTAFQKPTWFPKESFPLSNNNNSGHILPMSSVYIFLENWSMQLLS